MLTFLFLNNRNISTNFQIKREWKFISKLVGMMLFNKTIQILVNFYPSILSLWQILQINNFKNEKLKTLQFKLWKQIDLFLFYIEL